MRIAGRVFLSVCLLQTSSCDANLMRVSPGLDILVKKGELAN